MTNQTKKNKPRQNKKLTKILTDRVKTNVDLMREDRIEIARLERDGHTYRCACRIVWGDGQCECKQVEKSESYTGDTNYERIDDEKKNTGRRKNLSAEKIKKNQEKFTI